MRVIGILWVLIALMEVNCNNESGCVKHEWENVFCAKYVISRCVKHAHVKKEREEEMGDACYGQKR